MKKSHWAIISLCLGCIAGIIAYGVFYKTYEEPLALEHYEPEAFIKLTSTPAPTIPFLNITPTPKPHKKIPIIMYHYVEHVEVPEGDENARKKRSLSIHPSVFEQHLRSLSAAGYESYFVREVPDLLRENTILPDKNVVLTFDDGYASFYSVVLPLLKKYNMRGTLYVMPNYIGREGFLNKRQLEEIIDSNLVEIGAHTLDHAHLKGMSASAARTQIQTSKTALEELFDIKVESFAYPFGAFDEQTIQLTKEASYSAAVSVMTSALHTEDDLFYLYRLRAGMLSGKDAAQFLEAYNK